MFRPICLGFIALLVVAAPAMGEPLESLLLKPDPDVLMGVLPNGLRYAIKQHPSHQKEVIDLYVAAGSLDESDADRGLAHFLEHMAFNGSRRFPAASLVNTFETAGIAIGRDQNATTGYFGTTYGLDIPNETSDKLDLALRWLGDIADGLKIDPVEVDRERGVVLSEYRLGLGPARSLSDERQAFLMPEMRATLHRPIGQMQTIESARADALKVFYQRWYRPENAIVIAVGDEPVATMKARIEATFSRWRSPTTAQERYPAGRIDFHRASDARSLFDPHASNGAGLCRYSPKATHHPEDVAATKDRLADNIWASIFNERMARRARTDDAPFLSATGGYSVAFRSVGQTCFAAMPLGDNWRAALAALTTEIRRLELYGVTPKELDEAKRRMLANADASVASASTQAPEPIASSILDNILEDNTFDTAEEQRRVDRLALAELDPAAISTAFRMHWTAASPPLVFTTSAAEIPHADLMAAWRQTGAAPDPPAPTDRVVAKWAYGDAAKPGWVLARQVFKDPDFVRLTFANDLVVNFKQTDFSKNQVGVSILFGAGQLEFPVSRITDVAIGSTLLFSGGLQRNDLNDISALCVGHACSVGLQCGRDAFNLGGATRTEDLDLELQILTALLTEPGFRKSMAASVPTAASTFFRQLKITPAVMSSIKLQEMLPPPHVVEVPSEAHLASLTANDFAGLLTGPLTTDPLEVTIVGDIDEATMTASVARTLGALPPRKPGDRTLPGAPLLHFASTPPPPAILYHEGAKDQALVQLTWPLFVWSSDRAHETAVVRLLGQVLQDELFERIRQKLGKSYTPSAAVNIPRGEQGSLTVTLQTSPDAVELVRHEALAIAGDLSAGKITAEALEAARRPIVEAMAKRKTFNSWWMSVLSGSARRPEQLAVQHTADIDIASAVPSELQAEARLWLAGAPYTVIVLPQPAPPSGPAPPSNALAVTSPR